MRSLEKDVRHRVGISGHKGAETPPHGASKRQALVRFMLYKMQARRKRSGTNVKTERIALCCEEFYPCVCAPCCCRRVWPSPSRPAGRVMGLARATVPAIVQAPGLAPDQDLARVPGTIMTVPDRVPVSGWPWVPRFWAASSAAPWPPSRPNLLRRRLRRRTTIPRPHRQSTVGSGPPRGDAPTWGRLLLGRPLTTGIA